MYAIRSYYGSHAISADYPGELVDAVREATGAGTVMFAAGAVGDSSPIRPNADTSEARASCSPRGAKEDLQGTWWDVVRLPGLSRG